MAVPLLAKNPWSAWNPKCRTPQNCLQKLNFLKLDAKKEEISEETVKYTLSVDEEVVMYDENEEKINNEMWKIARNVLASLQNKFVAVRTFYLHPSLLISFLPITYLLFSFCQFLMVKQDLDE